MKPVNWSLDRKGSLIIRGVARIFQRGGHTVSKWGYSPDCHYGQDIVMAFSPPVVGCSVKKACKRGGSRAPQEHPLATPLLMMEFIVILFFFFFQQFCPRKGWKGLTVFRTSTFNFSYFFSSGKYFAHFNVGYCLLKRNISPITVEVLFLVSWKF